MSHHVPPAKLPTRRDVSMALLLKMRPRLLALQHIAALEEVDRLRALINTPATADFIEAVPLEAAHQIERWGPDHDAGKSPWDWFWTCGYLAGKAAQAALTGDLEKAKHHTVTTAALMLNWHRRLAGEQPS